MVEELAEGLDVIAHHLVRVGRPPRFHDDASDAGLVADDVEWTQIDDRLDVFRILQGQHIPAEVAQRVPRGGQKAVGRDGIVTVAMELAGEIRADEAGPAGHENPHG